MNTQNHRRTDSTVDLDRILKELEKLIRADEAALARQDFRAFADQQGVKTAFVHRLVEICAGGPPEGFEKRVEAVIRAQDANAAWLEDTMQANIAERVSLSKGRRTVHRFSRSYGKTNRPMLKRDGAVQEIPHRGGFSDLA